MMRSHSSWECKFLLKRMVETCGFIYPCSSSIIFVWFVHLINHLPPPFANFHFLCKTPEKKNTSRKQNGKHQRWDGISMCFWQNAVGSAHGLLAGLHKFHGQLFSRLAWLRLDVCLWKTGSRSLTKTPSFQNAALRFKRKITVFLRFLPKFENT